MKNHEDMCAIASLGRPLKWGPCCSTNRACLYCNGNIQEMTHTVDREHLNHHQINLIVTPPIKTGIMMGTWIPSCSIPSISGIQRANRLQKASKHPHNTK